MQSYINRNGILKYWILSSRWGSDKTTDNKCQCKNETLTRRHRTICFNVPHLNLSRKIISYLFLTDTKAAAVVIE